MPPRPKTLAIVPALRKCAANGCQRTFAPETKAQVICRTCEATIERSLRPNPPRAMFETRTYTEPSYTG